jgi:glycosyltransferase involved in cell wall biosynthesis
MKIGLIYHQYRPAGGLEKYLIEFTRRLAAAGHEMQVMTSRVDAAVRAALPGVQWHEVSSPRGLPIMKLWHFDHIASTEVKRLPVDFTIGFGRTTVHDFHRAGGGVHALYSRLLPWYKRWSLKNLMELSLEKRLYQGQTTGHFIFNSARVMAQAQGLYPNARERGSVIYTAVESAQFRPAEDRHTLRDQVCAELNTDRRKPIGLFVSLSHRRKGLHTLLQAWRGIDATLWIAGKPLTPEWQQQISVLGLEARVRALPVTNDLTRLYQAADWFVHPTLYDACANTVLQSMCCGLPGLISTQDGAVDHIRDGQNSFLMPRPQQAEDLQTLLKRAFALDEEQRQSIGQQARATMLPLTWENHLAGWERLFNAGRAHRAG